MRMKQLILSAIALATIVACSEKETKTTVEEARPVRVSILEEQTIAKTLEYKANLVADEQVFYAPAATGRIEKIYVEVGDRVKAGDLIVEMNPTNLKQAELQLNNLEAEYNRAIKTVEIPPFFILLLNIFRYGFSFAPFIR